MNNNNIVNNGKHWWVRLGLVLSFGAQAQTNLAGTPPLIGKVVDASGQPLTGVAVELYQDDRIRAFDVGELAMR
ncbi:MAG: hypothetical protein NTW03_07880, partial [Verrucomicrobia bacterium]|nr:hypothetical protein [Verrucomicrobiota bacterium]